jgi:predicted transcriptional regulator of viral defense system
LAAQPFRPDADKAAAYLQRFSQAAFTERVGRLAAFAEQRLAAMP